MLYGIMLVRNGNLLYYPWKECIQQLFSCCSKVLVNIDPGQDNTLDELISMQLDLPEGKELEICINQWNMKNTGNGSELASQANALLSKIPIGEWVIYCQADELIHEKDASYFKNLTGRLDPIYTQIELYRTYFWESIHYRNPEHEIWLGRIFKNGTHTIGGDGMYLNRLEGEVFRSNAMLYHYSRVGTEEDITRRIRTLDSLFHDKEVVESFQPFKYNIPKEDLIHHTATHPASIIGYYE